MMRKIQFPLTILVMTFLVLGCAKKSEVPVVENSDVVAVPVAKPENPAPEPAPAPAPVAARNFDGEWKGVSGEETPLQFYVKGNQVDRMQAGYSANINNCSSNGSYGSDDPVPIQENSFTAIGSSPSKKVTFTATGKFTSPTQASGTLVWKGTSSICGDIDLKYDWQAEKVPGS